MVCYTFHMDIISIFAAEYFIYISTLLAVSYVLFMHERRHHMQHIAIIVGSAIVAWVLSHFLKDVIAHPRPDLALALITPDSVYSFPSGHASFMSALGFAAYYYNKKGAAVLLFLAVLTGIARVVVGVHYWYDIVGGFILGFFVAWSIVRLSRHLSFSR